jgi:hypothetical protein
MGAMNDGTEGFFKGVVRGFGGLFFKTQAAVWAVPGCKCSFLCHRASNSYFIPKK